MEELIEMFSFKAQKKNLDLYILVPRTVPTTLIGDPSRLRYITELIIDKLVVNLPLFVQNFRQILTNLLGNAIKFTSEGCITLKITLKVTEQDIATLRFEVVDTGVGKQTKLNSRTFIDLFWENISNNTYFFSFVSSRYSSQSTASSLSPILSSRSQLQ